MDAHQSSQAQADSLEISVASQMSVADKPEKIGCSTSKSCDGNLTINDLPDELLLAILSYMSVRELLVVIPRVCSRWETLSQDAELWDHGVCEFGWALNDEEMLRILQMVPQPRTLVVHRRVSPSAFEVLCANCHELTTLDLHPTNVYKTSEVKNLFNISTKIRSLKIPYQLFDEVFVKSALKLSHLRVLHLKGKFYNYSDAWLSSLADRCPQLCDLDLEDTDYVTEDMEYFLNVKRNTLKRICVTEISSSGRYVAPLLAVCTNTLEHVVLRGGDYYNRGREEEGYAGLGKLHNLQVLTFENVRGDSSRAFSLLFKSGGLSSLKKLQFMGCWCAMDDAVIAISRGCPGLRELTLHNCDQLTDAAFMDIHHLKQLEILSLSSCVPLGGATIPCIAALPALHTLRFGNVRLDRLQPGLEQILDVSGLRCLYIRGSSTLPVPFDRFPGRLVNFRELHLERCDEDRVSLDEMCKQMPGLKVYRKL